MGLDTNSWIDLDVDFSTKIIRQEIEENCLPSNNQVYHDSKWVSSKVNVFVWRALIDRIQTNGALNHRNIMPSPSCTSCGADYETPDHTLINCEHAVKVWHAIFSWCKIPIIPVNSVGQILSIPNTLPVTPDTRKIIHTVFLTGLWCIWKARNERIFNKSTMSNATMGDIKSLSFLWLNSRGKLATLKWRSWTKSLL
ncbi:hypothetical protein QVD17_28189 [Tagetes erecta]|uniref:Reverse transcriptase zinc-binding domain-containing protein n=1 Tax=Tagetes erecta TaxID=13708 RepID=A0AAD8KCC8_TARER|nr:hypothetical protein QVD17_28189 [Tagetes erecta]